MGEDNVQSVDLEELQKQITEQNENAERKIEIKITIGDGIDTPSIYMYSNSHSSKTHIIAIKSLYEIRNMMYQQNPELKKLDEMLDCNTSQSIVVSKDMKDTNKTVGYKLNGKEVDRYGNEV